MIQHEQQGETPVQFNDHTEMESIAGTRYQRHRILWVGGWGPMGLTADKSFTDHTQEKRSIWTMNHLKSAPVSQRWEAKVWITNMDIG